MPQRRRSSRRRDPEDTGPTIRLTWLGHASVLVDDRARVLTDPVLTGGLLHLHRRGGETPGAAPPDLDAALVSHLHADHLHLPSLALLPRGLPVLVPRGAGGLLRRCAVQPVEVSPGDVLTVGGATVTVVAARHAGTRWPWGRLRCPALGYVVEGGGTTYFPGDTVAVTQTSPALRALDVALLPVGGWGPWLRGQHLDPGSAAEWLAQLRPRVAVPIHYGTFWPRGFGWLRPSAFHGPERRFAEAARTTAPGVDVRLLAPGGSIEVTGPPPSAPQAGAVPHAP